MCQNAYKVVQNKVGLLDLAEALNNVSKACKVIVFPEIHFIDINQQ